MSPSEIREIANSRAITKRWMKGVDGLLPRTRQYEPASTDETADDDVPVFARDVPDNVANYMPVEADVPVQPPGGQPPEQTQRACTREEGVNGPGAAADDDAGDPLGPGSGRVMEVAGPVTRNPPGPGKPGGSATPHVPCHSITYWYDTATTACSSNVAAAGASDEVGDTQNPAAKTSPAGRVTPDHEAGGPDDGPSASSVHAILKNEKVREALRTGSKLRCRNRYKGGILDLRGIDGILPPSSSSRDLAMAVNRCLHVGREGREVRVLIHPGEAWTARDGVLGNPEDEQYRRVGEINHAEGVVLELEFSSEVTWPRSRVRRGASPERAEVIFRRLRSSKTDARRWTAYVDRTGGQKRVQFKSSTPNKNVAKTEALAEVARVYAGSNLAAPANRLFDYLLLDKEATPRHVGLAEARRSLLGSHSWSRQGAWVLGEPNSSD